VDIQQSVTVFTSPNPSHPTRKGRAPSGIDWGRKDGPPDRYHSLSFG
jgi:hypothetical protein